MTVIADRVCLVDRAVAPYLHGRAALDELQREMLVDRGSFEVRRKGVPYLSKEGYPFHFFHTVHADLAKAAGRSVDAPAAVFLRGSRSGGEEG